jgi:hypothetical protein
MEQTFKLSVKSALGVLAILVIASLLIFKLKSVEAAAVTLTITPSEIAISNSTNKVLSFIPATVMANGSTITVYYPSAYNDGTLVNGGVTTTKTGDANFTSAAAVVNTTTNTIVITVTAGGNLDTTNDFEITITGSQLVTPASAGSHSFTVITSVNDYGSVLQYVGDDNDVSVTGAVQPSLSFNIRDLTDASDTNTCDLGTVTTTTAPNADTTDDGAGECGYALAIGTNADNGFQATINSNQTFRNAGGYVVTGVVDNAAFAAGTEAYGLANVTAAATGHNGSGSFNQNITENTTASYTFQTDSSPVPAAGAQNFVSYTDSIQYTAAGGATDTTRVMHGFAIGSGTPTGAYSHIVTYLVTANF